MEKWKPILDFPGYEISSYGQVKSERSGRTLAIYPNQYDVPCVGLMRDGKQFHRSVTRLVARAFLPHKLGPFDTPINLDGDRMNNRVTNLAWRPRWFAVLYNRQFREPYSNPINLPIEDTKTGEVSANSIECAVRYGLLEKDVVLSILNRTYAWPTHQIFRVVE